MFLSLPRSFSRLHVPTRGMRRGLHSFAASRLSISRMDAVAQMKDFSRMKDSF